MISQNIGPVQNRLFFLNVYWLFDVISVFCQDFLNQPGFRPRCPAASCGDLNLYFKAFRDYPKQEASNETFNMEPDEVNDVKLVDVELK